MADTFEREISGRTITFHLPTDAQILVIGRLLRIAETNGEDEAKLAGTVFQLSKVLDILDSMVVEAEDRDWLEQLILAGKVNMSELVNVLREDEGDTNRATRRATKKAAVKKTTAKKTTARKTTRRADPQ